MSTSPATGPFVMAADFSGPYWVIREYTYQTVDTTTPRRTQRLHYVTVSDDRTPANQIMWRSKMFILAAEAELLYHRMVKNIPATVAAIEMGLPIDSRINEDQYNG